MTAKEARAKALSILYARNGTLAGAADRNQFHRLVKMVLRECQK